jgi:Skp family chaperone for outer membrane proteins
MTSKIFSVAAYAATLALTGATSALAQAPAAPAPLPPPQVSHGAAIPGICVFSGDRAIGQSTVGRFVFTRLQQLTQQASAEVSAEETTLNNDAKALDGQRATLDQSTFESRAAAIQVRANSLQRKVQQRNVEMQRTQEKALGRLSDEIAPLVRASYQAKGCSMLVNREALTLDLANPAMDITPQVVTALNAKITQFTFDRERLDQAAPGPAAPRPAAPAAPAAAPRR